MIAKLIVRGDDRADAVRRLTRALAEYEVVGVETNLGLLRAIASHPAFAAGDLDTGFLPRHAETLSLAGDQDDPVPLLAAATMAWLSDQNAARAPQRADPWSPWDTADAWRMNGDGYLNLILLNDGNTVAVRAHSLTEGVARLDFPARSVSVGSSEEADGITAIRIDGVRHRLRVVRDGEALVVIRDGRNHVFHPLDPLAPPKTVAALDGRLSAPIPARVARVLVAIGAAVTKGQPLIVLEAMKMELTLSAPRDGVIDAIRCNEGEMVQEGSDLITLEPVAAQ